MTLFYSKCEKVCYDMDLNQVSFRTRNGQWSGKPLKGVVVKRGRGIVLNTVRDRHHGVTNSSGLDLWYVFFNTMELKGTYGYTAKKLVLTSDEYTLEVHM